MKVIDRDMENTNRNLAPGCSIRCGSPDRSLAGLMISPQFKLSGEIGTIQD
ncbi:MAG: hypothetical protein ACWGOV_00290 [Acidiferrobacterales bacterium]